MDETMSTLEVEASPTSDLGAGPEVELANLGTSPEVELGAPEDAETAPPAEADPGFVVETFLGLAQSQQTLSSELILSPAVPAATRELVPTQDVVETVSTDKEKGLTLSPQSQRREVSTIPFYKLFSFATKMDVVLMAMGTIGAVANGMTKPLTAVIFGQLSNAFGKNAGNMSKMVEAVSQVGILNYVHGHFQVCLHYLFLGIGAGCAAFCETTFWMSAGERQAARIRTLYFRSILRQDMAFFEKETNTGEVLSRMSEDTTLIQNAIGEKVGKFIQLMSTFFGGFIIAYSKGWKLALVVTSALPLLVLAGGTMAMVMSRMASRGQRAYMEAGEVVQQVVAGIRTVASFTGEEKAAKDYDTALEKAYKAGLYQGLSSGLGMGFTLLILYLSYALALWYGSRLILRGESNGGAVINVVFAVLMGGMALGQASPCLGAFATGKAAAYKMFEVIHRVPPIDVYNTEGLTPPIMKGDIELQNIVFSYPTRPDFRIFNGFSLTIPAGTTAALVGESGSGKSTVINLLERFYDPHEGVVLIDGIDIKQLQLKWLRQRVGLVSQEPVLFGVSIRENILFGNEAASLDEVKVVCGLANAAKFIENLPQAYDTHVGHLGTQLSGGQKQRIAIARAMLKNPRILLLDEATSALDAESERLVQAALENVMVDRTTVIVAHRLTTIRNANSINVVQQGRIVEQGTHESLLANPEGAYSQLIKLQGMDQGSHAEPSETPRTELEGQPSSRRPSTTASTRSSRRLSSGQASSSRRLSTTTRSSRRLSSLTGSSIQAIADALQSPDETWENSAFARLASLNKPEAHVFLWGSLAAILNGVVFPLFGLLLSSMMAIFFNPNRHKLRKGADFWAGMFVLLGCACFVIIPTQMTCFAYVGQKLIKRIRLLTFQAVVRQEISWFDAEENSCGAVSSRLSTDAANVRGMVGDTLALTVQNLATIAAGLIIAFTATWQLALVVLALVPLLGLQGVMQVKLMTGFSADSKVMYEAASQIASDAITSIRTVASFGSEGKMLKLYEDKCGDPVKSGIRLAMVSGIGVLISNFALFGSYSLSFWYGSQLVKSHKSTFKKVLRVFFAITMAAIGVSHTTGMAPDLTKVRASVVSIFGIIDRKSKIDPSATHGKTLDALRGDIQFQHISFKYPNRPDIQIFRDFSIFVEAGQTAAFVGESGSGKSTALALIQRFYDPDSGNIYIDGEDIRQFQLKWLRQHMSMVGQEPVLFAGTLKYNISYGRQGIEVSDSEIEAAARVANAHGFISRLPQGYETQVGERGSRLSGGQKQRIAIARAVIKDPRILLLDEATSALDAESERLVQAALQQIMLNRTVLVVAHRLSTISSADIIAVVKNGVVAEQGRHKELLEIPDGAYSTLVRLHMR